MSIMTPNNKIDNSKPLLLTVHASDYGIGAILSQNSDGAEILCAYFSKYLNEYERWYDRIEREFLAIYYSFIQFEPHLISKKFFINSNQAPLVCKGLFPKKNLYWVKVSEKFNFEINHYHTSLIIAAKVFSKNPIPSN